MEKPTNFTLSLVDPIAASLVLKHERNFPANARDEILARTEDNHDFDFIADPRDLVSRIFRRNGRVGTYYGESWDEILAYNAKQVAAGTPSNCVAFEDSAGTIPLLAPLGSGKGCGILLDRSLGLVRGPELVTNGDFSGGTTGWTTGNSAIFTVASGIATLANGAASNGYAFQVVSTSPGVAYKITFSFVNGTAPAPRLFAGTSVFSANLGLVTTASSGNYTFSFTATTTSTWISISTNSTTISLTASFDNISARELPGNHRIQTSATARGEMSRRVNRLTGTETLATQSIATVATNSILSFSGAGSITLSGTATGTYAAGTHSITTTVGTLTLTVSGTVTQADCRYSADAGIGKTYQRVTSASDYDEEGFPAYLRRQTDDWSKAHINPNGATKVFVLTAIQKMSDAAIGAVLELGTNPASGSGNFSVLAPATVGPTYRMGSKGSTALVSTISDSTFPAPIRSLVVGIGDIANDVCSLTVNGTTTTSAIDQGTGTYTEQDVFFGARAGSSLFVNDREYSPPLILFMQPSDPGISAAAIRKLTKLFSKGIGL